jgi:hypothetical protein
VDYQPGPIGLGRWGTRYSATGSNCWTTRYRVSGSLAARGFKRAVGRVPEGWALEDETHRNNAFVLLNAYHLPHLSIGEVAVKKVGDHLWRLEVPVLNDRAIPSMTAVAVQGKLHRQDIATVAGAKVLSSGVVDNPYLDKVQLQARRPERLMVPGVDGLSTRILFFLIQGDGEATVTYDSLKGGKVSKKVVLREAGTAQKAAM